MPELTASKLGCVYLVDGDLQVCQFIQQTLAAEGYTVKHFPTAEAFLQQTLTDEPSCLLMDIVLPESSSTALCKELVKRQSACSIVMMSGRDDIVSSVEAMKLGAVDCLVKPCSEAMIRETVTFALNKSSALWQIQQEEKAVSAAVDSLTPREKEILQGVSAGLMTKEIAKQLGISHRTVDVHRSRIMEKLRVDSPTQLGHIMCVMERRQHRLDSMHNTLACAHLAESPTLPSDSQHQTSALT